MTFVASPPSLPGNILTLADSDFETGSPTWVSSSNATIVGASTTQAFIGTHSFSWTATAAADSIITTGFYPCTPGQGYDFSGLAWATYNHDSFIGVNWYTSAGAQIGSTIWSTDFPITGGFWQPLNLAGTSPATAAKFKLLAWVGTNVSLGEAFYIDMMYATATDVQILIDWDNPAFALQSQAGSDFLDATPWVRLVDNVSINRGRQNKVSEIQAGSANFTLQNDYGWFTKYNSNSPIAANLGGMVDIGARCQINIDDQNGNWYTRFDGQVSEIDQNVEAVGTTAIASIVCADVLAFLNRQQGLFCWTKEAVLNSAPWMHWTLDDQNNTGNLGVAAETSGNNGPALHPVTTNTTATISWRNSNGGVESLADASAPGKPDMCEFWGPGSDMGASVNALDSGVAGPYQTPLSSVYFTPAVSAGAAQDTFITSAGYTLVGQLNQQTGVMAPTNGNNFCAEVWFAMDPYIAAHQTANSGPFVAMSLGNSRSGACVVFGVWLSGTHLTCQIMSFGQPPAFVAWNFGTAATALASVGAELASDKVPLPHHMVANITGATGGASLEFYCDGVDIGAITLPIGVVYDTITIGGAYGGWGCFYGNVQLASLYQRLLTGAEIQQHCNMGQYGMWESPTDDCIATLGNFANIPPFWNGLVGQDSGLTLTDYFDITNSTPLAAMQIFEQAEQGLLYVPANGVLSFATRDYRQGHGAPDLQLPPDIYTAALGYQLIDQFIINEAAISTQTYQTGVASMNAASENQYGTYANGTSSSPVQLPLITWNRANAALGLPQYTNSPDPVLNDNVAWLVNTQCNSRLTYSSLSIDLLTLDPLSGVTISQLYGLEINNMVGLSGTLPASLANQTGANELFVEGINETIGLRQRTLTIYTSPASTQRAWIPGDATYGVIGSTSRVGLSAPDVSTTPAIGKDVAHDSGGPYWPPALIVEPTGVYQFGFLNFTGTSSSLTGNHGLQRIYQGDCIIVDVTCPASSTVTVGPDSEGNTYTQIASVQLPSAGAWKYVFASLNAAPLNSADSISIHGTTSQNYVTACFGLQNVLAIDTTAVTATGTSGTTSISTGVMSSGYDLEVVIDFNNSSAVDTTVPTGWNYAQNNFGLGSLYDTVFWTQGQGSTASNPFSVTHTSCAWGAVAMTFTIQPVTLNNPIGNGNQFIGSLEMRGLHDSLAVALQPPMTVVASMNHSQNIASGSIAAPQIIWDTIYIDSAGGMSAITGWPNWYVCTVPGFYEISGVARVTNNSSGSATGYIGIASQAAQAVSGATANPQTVNAYICPIGEEHQMNSPGNGLCMSPSTRIYLGVGDMVALCATQNTGSSDTTDDRSIMSIRWCGYSTINDQVMINSSLGGAGSVTQLPPYPTNPGPGGGGNGGSSGSTGKKTFQSTYTSTTNNAYYGTTGSHYPQLRSTNTNIYQGEPPSGSATGSQFGFVVFNYSAIHTALSGATVNWATLTCHNLYTWYGSCTLIIGWSTRTTWGNSASPSSATDHMSCQLAPFKQGETRTISLGGWVKSALTTATSLIIGNNATTSLQNYGYWAPQFSLTVNYTK